MLLDNLTPSMMESKPEVTVSKEHRLFVEKQLHLLQVENGTEILLLLGTKKSHTIFEVFPSELLEMQLTFIYLNIPPYLYGIKF